MIATGIIALLAARRRAKLRAAEPPARVPLPNPDMMAMERMLRRLDAGERLLRVDIALRAAAAELAEGEARIVVVRCAPDGAVEIRLTAPATLTAPWTGAERRWTMPGDVPVEELAANARAVGAPCIALTQIGVDEDDWDVLVDFEAAGLLAVDADPATADDVVRGLAVGLATSEFAEVAHLVGVGVDEAAFLGHRHAQVVPTVDEAIELAATLIGTPTTTTRSTFSLRARHTSGEMWEPAVVVVATAHAADVTPAVVRSISTRGGLAIVVGTPVAQAPWTLRPDGAMWSLDPLGIKLRPVGIDQEALDDLDELVEVECDVVEVVGRLAAPNPLDFSELVGARRAQRSQRSPRRGCRGVAPPGSATPGAGSVRRSTVGGDGPPPRQRGGRRPGLPSGQVRTLQDPRVGELVGHPSGRASRSAARTALWDLDVRDATFANVVSEARRAMARHVPPRVVTSGCAGR